MRKAYIYHPLHLRANKLKEEVHEDVEHIHNMVVVEDCSTSWSSDDDDQFTTISLDKIDGDDSSVANDDSTPSTLDDQVGSCMDDIATSSSPPSPYTFVSPCDMKQCGDEDELEVAISSMHEPT